MPFDRCACCENLYGLDGDDLAMVHKGIFGQGKHTGGRPVETRVMLTREMAIDLVKDLMSHFQISHSEVMGG
jgi:hypothetical protein